jgi:hypothetical protein
MRRSPWPILYMILGTLVVAAAAVSQLAPDSELAQRFGPNLATETFGILITLVFVQRFLERQDRVRRLRSSLGALRRGSRALARLMEAWAVLVKGGLRNPPRYPPDSFLELFEPHHTQVLSDLDPGADAGNPEGLPWCVWAAREIRACRDALQEIIRVYGTSLDAEYVEVLDALIDDEYIDIFLDLTDGDDETAADWQVRIRQTSGAREAHFRRLRAAVEEHNRLAHEAASIRDPKRLPKTQGVGVDLPPDWDLRVHHAVSGSWWKGEPAPAALRARGDARRPANGDR